MKNFMPAIAVGAVAALLAGGLTARASMVSKLKSTTQAVTTAAGGTLLPLKSGSSLICADASTTAYCGGAGAVTTSNSVSICNDGPPTCDFRCWSPDIAAGNVACITSSGTATLRIQTAEFVGGH